MNKKVRRILGYALLIASILIYFYPDYADWQMQRSSKKTAEGFRSEWEAAGLIGEVSGESLAQSAGEKPTEKTGSDEETAGKLQGSGEEPTGKAGAGEETAEKPTEKSGSDSEEKPAPIQVQNPGAAQDPGLTGRGVLYDQMAAYNEKLATKGQGLVDAWSYVQPPVEITMLEDTAIAYIKIPDMDVTLPLFVGASNKNMAKGAAILSETSMPIGGESTNCVIAGHRGYRGMGYFRDIEKLSIGSKIYITNPWETLCYEAVEIAIIEPDDVRSILIAQDKDRITLLTCHPYMSHGKKRYVVYCDRTELPQGASEESKVAAGDESQVQMPANGPSDEMPEDTGFSEKFIIAERILHFALPLIAGLAALIHLLRKRRRKE